ncbi:TraR/DksA family transcriptional regulator [Streptomyces albus]
MNTRITGESGTRLSPEDLAALRENLNEQRLFRREQLAQPALTAGADGGAGAVVADAAGAARAVVADAAGAVVAEAADAPGGARAGAGGHTRTDARAGADARAGSGEYAGVSPQAEVSAQLAACARMVLADVEAALERMDQGRYGRCHLCARPIARERLMIVPQARYCARCQLVRGAGR